MPLILYFQTPTMATKKCSKDLYSFGMDCVMEKTRDDVSKSPCVFNLKVMLVGRLEGVKSVLEEEIKLLEREEVKHEGDEEELTQVLDLLTWLEFKIGSRQKAMELNSKALALTNNQAPFSLGNRAYMMWCEGDVDQSRACVSTLSQLQQGICSTNGISADHHLALVQAHQAYCYLRLGGASNLLQSATLYDEALRIRPNSHLWRLQVGRVYRRLTHPNLLSKGQPFERRVKIERDKRAKDCFYHVTRHAPNPRLKAFAYSDLACMAGLRGDARQKLNHLCSKALSFNCNYPYVMLNCGRTLMKTNMSWALRLLTQASKLGTSSHIFFRLGSCLWNLSNTPTAKRARLVDYYRDEAEKAYREAFRFTPSNMPARYSLGKLLYVRGKVEDARKEFMKIISTVLTSLDEGYAQTLMKAYEQAALCQLDLCQDRNFLDSKPDSDTASRLKQEAEIMLIKALEIGVHLLTRKEIKLYLNNSLYSLLCLSGGKKNLPEALLLISRVYHLAKEPRRSLEALDQLMSHVSDNPEMVVLTLKSYLDLRSYERAYALLHVSTVRLGPSTIDEGLYKKIVLSTARARLLENSGQTARVFKAMFDHCRQQRRFQDNVHPEGAAQPPSPRFETEKGPDGDDVLDVLIFYDDSADGSGDNSSIENVCRELQQAMFTVFGLNVCHNMQVGLFIF